jgi:hypothetical protein
MRLAAVKSTHNFFLQSVGFRGVFCLNHSPGQFAQFFSGELAFARKFYGKLDDARLFFRRQSFDFFDDRCGCHNWIIAGYLDSSKGKLLPLSIQN